MKKIIANILALSMIIMPFTVAFPAFATPAHDWDVTGVYVINMNYQSSDYSHDMSLVQDGVGNLTGNGGSPAGANTYTWVITSGSVVGNTINFTAHYTATADAVTPQTVLQMTGTIAPDGSMSGTWSDNYQGADRSGTWSTTSGKATVLNQALLPQDFGVMNQSGIKGYTAGFGLDHGTLAHAQSVVVQLYSGTTLLQTDTAIISKFNADITGTQFSAPFDVFGTFDYVADGYWTNVRGTEYGQNLIPNKVIATVTLANSQIVSAENDTLTGDTTTIFPETFVATDPATGITSGDATLNGMNESSDAMGHSFWVSLAPFDTSSPVIPTGVYSTPDFGDIASNTPFSASLSLITTAGIPGNLPAVTPNTVYYFAAWSRINGTWYPGVVRQFTTAGNETPTAPAVQSVSPNFGATDGNDTVQITGTGFTGATAVHFGTNLGTGVVVNSDTSITAVSPAGTGTVDVTVTTPLGTSATSEADQFTYKLTGTVNGGPGVLHVDSITSDSMNANGTADGNYTDGWKYVFHITAPTNEPNLSIKFANWLSDAHVLPVANNMRIFSAQSSNATNEASAVTLTAANLYSSPALVMTGDTDLVTPGRQVNVTVEVSIPAGTANGVYSTSYGVQTLP